VEGLAYLISRRFVSGAGCPAAFIWVLKIDQPGDRDGAGGRTAEPDRLNISGF
jgi:hypothetical protein